MTTTSKQAMAKSCLIHRDCDTTQACSQEQCVDLCFCDNCNKGVNNARDFNGDTPLHRAAREKGHAILAKLLLAHSANVDSTDDLGETPLHSAARRNNVGVAKVLIENSANVDSTDNMGWTALHWAAHWGSVDVAKHLIAHSANLNAATVSSLYRGSEYIGKTPFQIALLSYPRNGGHQEMVELLRNA